MARVFREEALNALLIRKKTQKRNGARKKINQSPKKNALRRNAQVCLETGARFSKARTAI